MAETFGSTCHGAGRAASRNSARRNLDYQTVRGLAQLHLPPRLAFCGFGLFQTACASASKATHASPDSMGAAGRLRVVAAEKQACACRFWTA